ELCQVVLHLAPHAPDRDPEDALYALDQVDLFVGGGAFVHARAVAHQGDLGQVVDAALTQVLGRGADLLQGDTGVQQALDHLEHEDVAEAVQALGPRAGCGPDRRLHQTGASPVVQLAVGDPRGAARRRTPVPGVVIQVRQGVAEQQPLGPLWGRWGGAGLRVDAVHAFSILL